MLLSCIVTSYNCAALLERAVMSVLTQTRPADEILIADDASSDGSRAVAEGLAALHGRVRCLLRDQNLGVAANRDDAVRAARGRFVTTLDGDDYLLPDKLAAELAVLEADPDAVAVSDTVLLDAQAQPKAAVRTVVIEQTPPEARCAAFARQTLPVPKDPSYARAHFLAVGGYRATLQRYEDLDLMIRLADRVATWRHSGVTGTAYHIGGGLSRADRVDHFNSDFQVLRANRELLTGRYGAAVFEEMVRHRFRARMDGDPATDRLGAVLAGG